MSGKGPDLESIITREQKEEIVKSAIVKASDGELTGDEFSVRYDRRYAHIFSAVRDPRQKDGEIEVTFSISPFSYTETFFQNAASEAARAVHDILNKRIDVGMQPRPSQQEVKCLCCGARSRVVNKPRHHA